MLALQLALTFGLVICGFQEGFTNDSCNKDIYEAAEAGKAISRKTGRMAPKYKTVACYLLRRSLCARWSLKQNMAMDCELWAVVLATESDAAGI